MTVSGFSSRRRSDTSESGLPEINDSNIGFQEDDQYNILETNDGGEYNKIYFKDNPTPFDPAYGHLHPIISVQNNTDYKHIEGTPAFDLKTYSHVPYQESNEKKSKKSGVVMTTDTKTVNMGRSIYDQLVCKSKNQKRTTEVEDKSGYFDTSISGRERIANTENRTQKHKYFENTSNAAECIYTDAESENVEHQYFVLDSHLDIREVETSNDQKNTIGTETVYVNSRLNVDVNDIASKEGKSEDDTAHPYFILEANSRTLNPAANIKLSKAVQENAPERNHDYFILESKQQ